MISCRAFGAKEKNGKLENTLRNVIDRIKEKEIDCRFLFFLVTYIL
jgi:hypothetical protein